MKTIRPLFNVLRLGLVVVAGLLVPVIAHAQNEVHRWNWVPSGNSFLALGDLWTFNCPAKGTVTVWANTWDDTGTGSSNLDLAIEVRDKTGALLVDQFGSPFGGLGDEQFPCAVTSACGYWCPQVSEIPCGKGNPHTIAVYSYPSAESNALTGVACVGGGSYELVVSAQDKKGKDVSAKNIKLGGSANRKVPTWGGEMIDKMGPALNDEFIPAFYGGNPASAAAVASGEVHTEETFRLPDKIQK